MDRSSNNMYESMPKIELHLHMEGAIPIDAMWTLCQKYGGDPSVPDVEALKQRFVYKDFPHFIETWVWKNQFLREYEDFTFIAECVAKDLARQNVIYAEAFFSPADFYSHGLNAQEIALAIREGLKRVPEIEIALIADMVRDFGPETAATTMQQVNEVKDYKVVGIGIGGSEHRHPPELFTEIYEQARQMGFHTCAHAGEAAGAESIWGAINSLKVERIGHGTRAFEDPKLLDVLAEQQIPLDMCPISNLRTGVTQKIEDHPIRRYFECGLLVTVNTDDPKMFGNTLAEEYELLEKKLGFSYDEVTMLLINAVQASWMPEEKKHNYVNRFRQDVEN